MSRWNCPHRAHKIAVLCQWAQKEKKPDPLTEEKKLRVEQPDGDDWKDRPTVLWTATFIDHQLQGIHSKPVISVFVPAHFTSKIDRFSNSKQEKLTIGEGGICPGDRMKNRPIQRR
jgi:hypothetical protein